MFNKPAEESQEPEEEVESSEDSAQFLAMAKEISDELLDELFNDENTPQAEVETILISEYDAGDEVEQLSDKEVSMVNYNEVNVVNHESLEDIVEHLEGAEIIGDLPERVLFDDIYETVFICATAGIMHTIRRKKHFLPIMRVGTVSNRCFYLSYGHVVLLSVVLHLIQQ